MDVESKIKAYKFVAYSTFAFAVLAVFSVSMTLPMVYNYIHHVRQQMQSEVSYCKVRLYWKEISKPELPENFSIQCRSLKMKNFFRTRTFKTYISLLTREEKQF